MPIIVPFFQERGLSQLEIFLLESVWAITILVLEVPSGYLADCLGRKKSVVSGAIFSTLGFSIYAAAAGVESFILANVLFGVGYSFISGADSAMAYDSYAALSRREDYRRFEAYSNSICGIAEGVASLLGGALALISLATPIVGQVIVYFTLIPLSLLLVEPDRELMPEGSAVSEVIRITKYALHGHAEVKWLIIYGATASTLTHTMVWITQPYYQLVGVPLTWFGVLWAIQLVALALFSRYSVEYEQFVGKKRALISFLLVGVVAYAILGLIPSRYTLPAILGFYFIRGAHIPVLQDYINELVESDIRATVLSVKNLVQKLMYATFGPLIGLVMDSYSLPTALLFSGVLYGVIGLLVLLRMAYLKIL
jgi:MFS family permease